MLVEEIKSYYLHEKISCNPHVNSKNLHSEPEGLGPARQQTPIGGKIKSLLPTELYKDILGSSQCLKGVVHPQNDFFSIDYTPHGDLSPIIIFWFCRIPKTTI